MPVAALDSRPDRSAVAKALCAQRTAQRTAQGASLRELEDDGTAFSAARKLGFSDLDALYEAVGLDKLSVPGLLAHLGFAAPSA